MITKVILVNIPFGAWYGGAFCGKAYLLHDGGWFVAKNKSLHFNIGDSPEKHSEESGVLHVHNFTIEKYRIRTKLENILEGLDREI